MDRISEKTTVSLGIAVLVIGSAAMWVAGVNADRSYSAQAVEEVRSDQQKYNANLEEIRNRLSRIEGALKLPEEGK
jgi:hypothetical protein